MNKIIFETTKSRKQFKNQMIVKFEKNIVNID